jgi:hypothetical protein
LFPFTVLSMTSCPTFCFHFCFHWDRRIP